ncbi:sigma-54-dependent Fis family transcriptional regulator [Rhizobacter sp. Root1221]|uniref:sigma-54-dependent Fis family transcriptional regulator n=1 Tax=Rhizobacter sp. Root1221 TaxID=1736433 RepID=UPI00070128E4|nr:sigma-54-dependent Fis family transcriptional regulator [Rhizobacter sp. Root1221]KQW01511.1 Fis family transcriptional regulator [Rhizobacter sp. Root1221]
MKPSPSRISLAEVSRATGAMMRRGEPSPLDSGQHPLMSDLTECLFFSPGDGRIWLNDQRMVLMHTSSLGALRRELIDSLGLERARGLLTRAGYESGARDAELVRQRWPDGDAISTFMAGTRLHALEGVVKVEPLEFDFDVARGTYHGEFLWHHSSEDDEHIGAYGLGTEPACWSQIGYACGYVTGMLGKPVIFREVECRSMGSAVCRVIGKNADAWGDISEDLRYLNVQDFLSTQAFVGAATSAASRAVLGGAVLAESGEQEMVGVSSAFKSACHMLSRVAPTQATVLFTGESGVGKELFASMLHRISPRKEKPFVALNCAAIPDTLIESELFGVERGAFTGATVSRPGRFERADGGTLFLDEIGTLSLVGQGKLLRALQEGEIERVGGSRTVKVDVRVVAATNVDLQAEVRAGRFREDLYFRLDVFPIPLPPLRERREDIPLLMNYFLHRYCRRHGRTVHGYTPRAVKALLNYEFPGNIRELQNLVERGVITADDGGVIDVPHMLRREQLRDAALLSVGAGGTLATASSPAEEDAPAAQSLLARLRETGQPGVSLDAIERQLMEEAVQEADGKLSAAARLLGLTRAQLAYRLKAVQKG